MGVETKAFHRENFEYSAKKLFFACEQNCILSDH